MSEFEKILAFFIPIIHYSDIPKFQQAAGELSPDRSMRTRLVLRLRRIRVGMMPHQLSSIEKPMK